MGAALGAAPAETSAVQMLVSAGLAGTGRLGRWIPVEVVIDNKGDDIDGTLVISWGNAQIEREVSVPAPSRKNFSAFLRTGDVRDIVTATLRSRNHNPITVTAPLRVIGTDENFALCVAGADHTAATCSATLPVEAMPRVWRGYDTADQVIVADLSTLDGHQRDALLLWQAARASENAGQFVRPGITLPEQSRWRGARRLLGAYVLVLGIVTIPALRRRRSTAAAAVALVAFAASCAAIAHHRETPVTIHHSSALRQYAGVRAMLVDVTGSADFASEGVYAITPAVLDGAMNVGAAYGAPSTQRFDADGLPVLAGRFGFGARQPFQLEATADPVLEVAQQDGRHRITNVSNHELRNCELPPSFSPRSIPVLAPHQSIEAVPGSLDPDPLMRCTFSAEPVAFGDGNHQFAFVGTTSLTYDFGSRGGPR